MTLKSETVPRHSQVTSLKEFEKRDTGQYDLPTAMSTVLSALTVPTPPSVAHWYRRI